VAERPTRAALDQIDKEFEAEPEVAPARKEISTATRPVNETRSSLPANGSQVIRPASSSSPARRSIARRSSTAVNKAPLISREEEYAYIRSDLMTVLVLTVLMVIVLVVLTFVIGR
jgi:hypothetical protein